MPLVGTTLAPGCTAVGAGPTLEALVVVTAEPAQVDDGRAVDTSVTGVGVRPSGAAADAESVVSSRAITRETRMAAAIAPAMIRSRVNLLIADSGCGAAADAHPPGPFGWRPAASGPAGPGP